MTKQIRIENADTSDHKVDVEVWQGEEKIRTIHLDHPTQILSDYVYDGQHIVIREVKR